MPKTLAASSGHPVIPLPQGSLLIVLDGNDNAQDCLHHKTARIACEGRDFVFVHLPETVSRS